MSSPLRTSTPPADNTVVTFRQKLSAFAGLSKGWNGYDAPAPSSNAISLADQFLTVLSRGPVSPPRLAPSVVGGVGITMRNQGRKVYVEFYNDGVVHALFSDGIEEPQTKPVEPTQDGFGRLLQQIRNYLYAVPRMFS